MITFSLEESNETQTAGSWCATVGYIANLSTIKCEHMVYHIAIICLMRT